ncbi:MAG: class I SAM-dependent methyltransferase [Fulvivirga sp.]|nr:class I SAM-dependent methyltransferase [Fulvivirga sp.]
MEQQSEWFDEWFDSPYYHILYKNRDYQEARQFIDRLIKYFKITPGHKVLDLACGKGRHSIYLNEKGFDVVGVDLSERNIQHAKKFENERLKFDTHDMREVYAEEEFDFVLNMFTSFGYFENDKENEQAVCAAAKNLKPGGGLLIDFLNPYRVINNLVPQEQRTVEGITFDISRSLSDDGYIEKNISFEDQGKSHAFKERVKAIRRIEFLEYFRKAGLKLITTFGNYQLEAYEPEKSDRMIFVTQK